jgi:hypothetical protein
VETLCVTQPQIGPARISGRSLSHRHSFHHSRFVEIGIKEGATRYSSPRLPPPSSPFLLGAMPLSWVCVGVRGLVIPVGELEGDAGSPDTRFCSSSTVRLRLTPQEGQTARKQRAQESCPWSSIQEVGRTSCTCTGTNNMICQWQDSLENGSIQRCDSTLHSEEI